MNRVLLVLVAGSVLAAGASGAGKPLGSALPPALNPSTGPAIYVAASGSDRNPGTRERPKRTIQRALDRARPGQRILVRAGTYLETLRFSRSGTPQAPITLAAYRKERPHISPGRRDEDTYALVITASYVRVKGFVLQGASGRSSANVYVKEEASNVELRGNDVRRGQDQGIYTEPGTRNVQIIGNVIHGNGAGLEGQHQSHGLYINGFSHLVADNVIYDHPHGFGIHVYDRNSGTVIVGNTVAYSGMSGIVIGGAEARGITVRNNIFARNGRYGIGHDADNPESSRVDTNLLYANGWGDIQPDFEGTDFSGGNLNAPPRFVSPRARNFRLRARSAAIDRALPEFSKGADLDGVLRPQGRGPDLGAFEFSPK